jgi:hypothetical protein
MQARDSFYFQFSKWFAGLPKLSTFGSKIRNIFQLSAHFELKNTF